ncbi:MAG: exodeoxyribonuclease VII small subunit, partial [Alistipes sp.]|nr:exodeoxyribonuclease VII small subunit [Alistipes sp.]
MSTKKITYAEAMAEVEKILVRLRSGEISVDELSSDVARATRLIAECRK